MSRTLVVSGLVAVAVLAISGSASAGSKTITAKLPSGYTLVAIAPNGVVTTSSSKSAKLKAPAKKVSLQLFKGKKYYGPVVAPSGKKSRVVTAFFAGSALGRVSIQKGYATVEPKPSAIDEAVTARAKAGKPIGAGRAGIVGIGKKLSAQASVNAQSSESGLYEGVTQTNAEGGSDVDRDGLPNAFDLDDNGNTTPDPVDRETANAVSDTNSSMLWVSSSVGGSITATVNASTGTATQSQLDALFSNYAKLQFGLYTPGSTGGSISAVEVDATNLSFLKSAEIFGPLDPGVPTGQAWSSFDSDSNGLLNLYRSSDTSFYISVKPHVTSSNLLPGTPLLVQATKNGVRETLSASVPTYFVTTPALNSMSAGGSTTNMTYPLDFGSPGGYGSPIAVADGKITFNIFRPQRAVVAGETGGDGLMSMGGLSYAVEPRIDGVQMPSGNFGCATSYYSNLSLTLTPVDETVSYDTLLDSAGDSVPSASDTISFTLDVRQCLADKGLSPDGATINMDIVAFDQNKPNRGDTLQPITIKLP